MKIFLKNLICFLALAFCLLVIPASQAAGLVPCEGPDCRPCHIFALIVNITEFLFEDIALPLAGLLFLIGGIMMLTAGGAESRFKKGKEILVNTLVGLVIVLSAFAIVNTLITFFAAGQFANGWWRVCQ